MIKIFCKTKDIENYLKDITEIGFVPTMGNLHQGHMSLLSESIKNNDTSVISIFVNPTQFGNGEDFTTYPRTLERDIEKIKSLDSKDKTILIFSPDSETEIYPIAKESIKAFGPCNILEGAMRPGHFDGVMSVVKRLFDIVGPKNAYFGKKDYQQLTLIKLLVKKFELNINIVSMPVIREVSGLAMSSRNSKLSPKQLEQALALRQNLLKIEGYIHESMVLEDIKLRIAKILTDKRYNYLTLCNQETLEPIKSLSEQSVLLGNLQIGNTKLLDYLEI
jgi:pantoate--beta-alanine ligase